MKNLGAAVILAVIVICFIGIVSNTSEEITARECDELGATMLDGDPYSCAPIKPKEGQPHD